MSTERQRHACHERLQGLAAASLDTESLREEAIADLSRTIGFDRWCWPLADPVSLLGHSGIAEVDYFPTLPQMLVLEQQSDVVHKAELAQAPSPVVSLHERTGGELRRSVRWERCLEPYGMGDQVTLACRDGHGCWGWIEAHRSSDDRPFDDQDVGMLRDAAPVLGAALRRSIAGTAASASVEPPRPPGVLVIDQSLHPVSWTSTAWEWLRGFPGAGMYERAGILPTAVYSVAGRVISGRAEPAVMRLRTPAGRWVTVDGEPLQGEEAGRVAVTIRVSTPQEVLDMLTRICALSPRETELVSLLATGLQTRELASQLFISPYTVKDHLKTVFAKVGVRSRRELISVIMGTAGAPADDAAASAG
jgi:DNA-binding CsgD family transcriptional regulator